jgi:hypothetical protein
MYMYTEMNLKMYRNMYYVLVHESEFKHVLHVHVHENGLGHVYVHVNELELVHERNMHIFT